jgi:AraC family transcriptional regulator
MRSTVGHWGDVQVRVVDEHIGVRSNWIFCDTQHVLIAHLGGSIRDIETQLDSVDLAVPPLGAGDVSLVPAGRRYHARAIGGLVRYAEVRVAPKARWLAVGTDVDVDHGEAQLGRRDESLYRAIERLAALTGRTDDVSQMAAHSISHSVCLHLRETYGANGRVGDVEDVPALTTRAVGQLRSYVRAHLDQYITLAALTDLVGLSTHRLLIAFRRTFGTTPAQYIIAERLARARWLLAHTAYDISTIAGATGFASHSHLTTTFKRHVGVTPHVFRRGMAPVGAETQCDAVGRL